MEESSFKLASFEAPAPVFKEDKFFISVDNLRLIGYSLPTRSPEYSQDTFDIESHYTTGTLSPYALQVLGQIQIDSVVELKFGSYKKDQIHTKR